jgi:hypothetical protein
MWISVTWLRIEVEGCCERSNEQCSEHGNEHLACIKCGEYFD